jgi:L-cystine uptake protein TcyP (sodium:dicarboxylate symporter family)
MYFNIYLFEVISTALITSTALSHMRLYQSLASLFLTRYSMAKMGTVVSEYAFFILAAKMFFVYELKDCFTSIKWEVLYYVDMFLMLSLWALFLQALFSRNPIYENTKFFRNNTSTMPPSLFT